MRRFIAGLVLIAAALFSSRLAAQAQKSDSVIKVPSHHAIGFGYFATLGSYWQIEAAEIGYVRRMSRGLAAVSVSARIGTFIDETAVTGSSRGLAFATTIGARTRMKRIAQIGEDDRGTAIGLDVTMEASAYAASGSPFPQGARWGAIALLPGLRIGNAAVVIGPSVFFGAGNPVVRGLLAFRGEAPLARRVRHP